MTRACYIYKNEKVGHIFSLHSLKTHALHPLGCSLTNKAYLIDRKRKRWDIAFHRDTQLQSIIYTSLSCVWWDYPIADSGFIWNKFIFCQKITAARCLQSNTETKTTAKPWRRIRTLQHPFLTLLSYCASKNLQGCEWREHLSSLNHHDLSTTFKRLLFRCSGVMSYLKCGVYQSHFRQSTLHLFIPVELLSFVCTHLLWWLNVTSIYTDFLWTYSHLLS